jgi:hypothetical protein
MTRAQTAILAAFAALSGAATCQQKTDTRVEEQLDVQIDAGYSWVADAERERQAHLEQLERERLSIGAVVIAREVDTTVTTYGPDGGVASVAVTKDRTRARHAPVVQEKGVDTTQAVDVHQDTHQGAQGSLQAHVALKAKGEEVVEKSRSWGPPWWVWILALAGAAALWFFGPKLLTVAKKAIWPLA